MSEFLPIAKSELEKPGEVFDAIAAVRKVAKAQRAAYNESVQTMSELCSQLRGVDLLISGQIHGRGGTTVDKNDPRSKVDKLLVRVGSARVDTYEGHGDLITKNTPFIELTTWTVDADELICARLGVGEFGVTAEVVESAPVQA
jgi:hypothetical protein